MLNRGICWVCGLKLGWSMTLLTICCVSKSCFQTLVYDRYLFLALSSAVYAADVGIWIYVPYILYSLLSRPANAQMFISNSLYIVSTPSCFSASTSSSGRVDIPANRKHRHGCYTYKAVRILYAATKQTCYTYLSFTECILSFNNHHANIVVY